MLWITIFIFGLHSSQAVFKGTSIMCDCTTTHCKAHNMKYCNTTSMCFSQFLDLHDGIHPIVRGCIQSKTPLLCENRRPAIPNGAWPWLLCCNSNLCNRDVVPTAPPWFVMATEGSNTTTTTIDKTLETHESSNNYTDQTHLNNSEAPSSDHILSFEETPSSFQNSNNVKSRASSLPHIISPIYISVLVLGIISLIIIGIVAAIVLKRSNRFYVEQYGALEHQHDLTCLKRNIMTYPPPAHVMCDCDSQVESLSQCSQSYVQVVYPNGESNGA